MNLRLNLYVSELFDCDDQPNNSYCQAVNAGLYAAAEKRAFAGLPNNFEGFYVVEYSPRLDEQLELKSLPALVFIDTDTGETVARKYRGDIVDHKVEKTYTSLSKYTATGEGDSYTDGDGNTLSLELLRQQMGGWSIGVIPTTGQALGGCPSWLPQVVCNWSSIVSTAILVLLGFLLLTTIRR